MAFVGSAAGGSIFGIIGNYFKAQQEIKDRENQRKHDLEVRKLDREEMKLESELNIQEKTAEFQGKANLKKIEGDIAKDIADAEVLIAVYKHDSATYSKGAVKNLNGFFAGIVALMLVFVDMLRGLIRPTTTVYLIVLETAIAWYLFNALNKLDSLPVTVLSDLLVMIVSSVVFLTATAVTFWFGSRKGSITK